MHVLLVDSVRNDRELAARFLGGAGHAVAVATDLRSAQAGVVEQLPDLVVLDPSIGLGAAITLIKALRSETSKHVHVLIAGAKLPADLHSLVTAGADDFMKKPYDRDELLLRAGAPERIAKWAAKAFAGPSEGESGGRTIEALKAWANIDEAASRDVGQLLGRPLVAATNPQPLEGTDFKAALCLTLTANKIDVRFTIGVARASLERAAEHVFGAAGSSDDELHDIVRELANLIAGRFKGAAAGESVPLTMGLPLDLDAAPASARRSLAVRSFVLQDDAKTIAIGVLVEVLASPLRIVRVAELKEGMVLAHDVLNANGGMLVPAGRLTPLRISRVLRALPAKAEVEVAHAEETAQAG